MAAVVPLDDGSDASEHEVASLDPSKLHTRLFKVSGAEIIVHVSQDPSSQSFWQEYTVALWILRTKNPDKARERCVETRPSVQEMHMRLWPGEVVQEASSKRRKKKSQKVWRNSQRVSTFFVECTLTTSMVISYMLFAASSSRRSPADRAYAVQCFKDLLRKLAEVRPEFEFWFQRHGDDEWTLVTCSVDSNGQYLFSGSSLWTTDFYRQARDLKGFQGKLTVRVLPCLPCSGTMLVLCGLRISQT